jgi:hypothetical protein
MMPPVPPTPEPAPAPEEPKLNAAQRAALSGAIGLAVWPEPVSGFLGGALLSLGKTLVNRWRAAPPSREGRARAAKRRYHGALRMLARSGLGGIELATAKEAARQQYLRELAEALK